MAADQRVAGHGRRRRPCLRPWAARPSLRALAGAGRRSRPCRRPCRPKEGRSDPAAGRALLSSADHPHAAAAGRRCAVARLQMEDPARSGCRQSRLLAVLAVAHHRDQAQAHHGCRRRCTLQARSPLARARPARAPGRAACGSGAPARAGRPSFPGACRHCCCCSLPQTPLGASCAALRALCRVRPSFLIVNGGNKRPRRAEGKRGGVKSVTGLLSRSAMGPLSFHTSSKSAPRT